MYSIVPGKTLNDKMGLMSLTFIVLFGSPFRTFYKETEIYEVHYILVSSLEVREER